MKTAIIAAAQTLTALALSANAAFAGPPAELKPTAVDGPGVYVADLEAQKAWYMDKLGMTVRDTMKRGDKPFEYIMSFGNTGGAIMALAQSAQRPPGLNAFSRVILAVPNAKGLAEWLKTQGVENREVIPNVAYFIRDPEGNPVELYTPPPRK
jgi:catechol 2,3-dioxygenase-like lactoylglutathione lyase family enzyme